MRFLNPTFMKKYLPASLCTLFISMVLFSCTPSYEDLGENNIGEVLIKHQWNVQVINSNTNTSYNFKDFTLLFDKGGLAVFNMDQTQVKGNWNMINEKVNLQLNATEISVKKLNRSWNVVENKSGSIRFVCTDPTSGEQLLLTKN